MFNGHWVERKFSPFTTCSLCGNKMGGGKAYIEELNPFGGVFCEDCIHMRHEMVEAFEIEDWRIETAMWRVGFRMWQRGVTDLGLIAAGIQFFLHQYTESHPTETDWADWMDNPEMAKGIAEWILKRKDGHEIEYHVLVQQLRRVPSSDSYKNPFPYDIEGNEPKVEVVRAKTAAAALDATHARLAVAMQCRVMDAPILSLDNYSAFILWDETPFVTLLSVVDR